MVKEQSITFIHSDSHKGTSWRRITLLLTLASFSQSKRYEWNPNYKEEVYRGRDNITGIF